MSKECGFCLFLTFRNLIILKIQGYSVIYTVWFWFCSFIDILQWFIEKKTVKLVWSGLKKANSFVFSKKFYFLCSCWSSESFTNCKHIFVEFDYDSIFPAEINTLEQDLPDLWVPLSCCVVYCHLNYCVIKSHIPMLSFHW